MSNKKQCSNCARCDIVVRTWGSYYRCRRGDVLKRVDPDYCCGKGWRSKDEKPMRGRRSMT